MAPAASPGAPLVIHRSPDRPCSKSTQADVCVSLRGPLLWHRISRCSHRGLDSLRPSLPLTPERAPAVGVCGCTTMGAPLLRAPMATRRRGVVSRSYALGNTRRRSRAGRVSGAGALSPLPCARGSAPACDSGSCTPPWRDSRTASAAALPSRGAWTASIRTPAGLELGAAPIRVAAALSASAGVRQQATPCVHIVCVADPRYRVSSYVPRDISYD